MTVEEKISRLKEAYRLVLGDRPSRMFMAKLESLLDEGRHDEDELRDRCRRTEGMVKIFLDVRLARDIGSCWRTIIEDTV